MIYIFHCFTTYHIAIIILSLFVKENKYKNMKILLILLLYNETSEHKKTISKAKSYNKSSCWYQSSINKS